MRVTRSLSIVKAPPGAPVATVFLKPTFSIHAEGRTGLSVGVRAQTLKPERESAVERAAPSRS